MTFENKLATVVNKDIDVEVATNQVVHASFGVGALVGIRYSFFEVQSKMQEIIK